MQYRYYCVDSTLCLHDHLPVDKAQALGATRLSSQRQAPMSGQSAGQIYHGKSSERVDEQYRP